MPKVEPKKIKPFRSLTVNLAVAFLTLSAVLLIIAGSLQIYFSFQAQQKIIANQQELIAQNAANAVRNFVREKFTILEKTAVLGNLATAGEEEQKLLLGRLLGKTPSFRQLLLLNAQEQELLRVSRLSKLLSAQSIKLNTDEVFSKVRHKETYISPVYIDKITSEPLVIMAVPITDNFGAFKGILVAEVNLKFMWDLVDSIKIGDKGLAYVVDRQGNLIAFRDISRVLKRENLGHLAEVGEFVKGGVLTHKSAAEIVKGILGTHVVASHALLGKPDWAIVIESPVVEAYRTVIRELRLSVAVLILSIILAVMFAIFISKRITRPIIKLNDATIKISKGDLDTRIEVKSEDEVGELAASFNQMVEDLQKTTVSRDILSQEVSERKKAEEALRESESKHRMLLANIPQKIFYKNLNSVYLLCNDAYARDLNIRTAEIKGKTDFDFYPEELAEKYRAIDKRIMQTGKLEELEEEYVKDGQKFTVQTVKAPVKNEQGDIIGIFGIFWDITDRKKAEEQQMALLKDLEGMNRVMVGRELKMIELKQAINKLSRELGRPEPYDKVSLAE
ncbi:MAG: PAS domain-containing protein [Candidatus Omnitrophica bacterium]|nr:PAS domain-containing protein [Candidatus Omnitrophota bacterium]